jgi:hypothetical protein
MLRCKRNICCYMMLTDMHPCHDRCRRLHHRQTNVCDVHRWPALQVKLAGQQAQDLVARTQVLLGETEDIERGGIRQLRAHLTHTRDLRQRVRSKMEDLRVSLRY